jgi:hypothetical protein
MSNTEEITSCVFFTSSYNTLSNIKNGETSNTKTIYFQNREKFDRDGNLRQVYNIMYSYTPHTYCFTLAVSATAN